MLEEREGVIYASSKAFRNSMAFLLIISLMEIIPDGIDSYFKFAFCTLFATLFGYLYIYSYIKFKVVLTERGVVLHTMPLFHVKIVQFDIAIEDIDRLENKELSSYLYFFNKKENVKEGEGLPISRESIDKLIDHIKKLNPEVRIT